MPLLRDEPETNNRALTGFAHDREHVAKLQDGVKEREFSATVARATHHGSATVGCAMPRARTRACGILLMIAAGCTPVPRAFRCMDSAACIDVAGNVRTREPSGWGRLWGARRQPTRPPLRELARGGPAGAGGHARPGRGGRGARLPRARRG